MCAAPALLRRLVGHNKIHGSGSRAFDWGLTEQVEASMLSTWTVAETVPIWG